MNIHPSAPAEKPKGDSAMRRLFTGLIAASALAVPIISFGGSIASASETPASGTLTWNYGDNGSENATPDCKLGQASEFHFILSGKGAKITNPGTGTATFDPSGTDSDDGGFNGASDNGAAHYYVSSTHDATVKSFVVTGVSWTGDKAPFLKLSSSGCVGDEVPPPPPVDVCPNLPGNQPEGTDCTPDTPPVDVCPELPGNQPPGTDCTPDNPPVDKCPGKPGMQGPNDSCDTPSNPPANNPPSHTPNLGKGAPGTGGEGEMGINPLNYLATAVLLGLGGYAARKKFASAS